MPERRHLVLEAAGLSLTRLVATDGAFGVVCGQAARALRSIGAASATTSEFGQPQKACTYVETASMVAPKVRQRTRTAERQEERP